MKSQVNSAASFTVTTGVVNANPQNFGFNVASGGAPDIVDNNWLADGGMASYDLRMSYTATNNGAADGSTFICTDASAGGNDFWASISSGLFVGATVRVYRFNAKTNTMTRIRSATVKSFVANSKEPNTPADHTITFNQTGEQILAGDMVWLDLDNDSNNPEARSFVNYLDPRLQQYGGWSAPWACEGESMFKLNDTNPCTYTHDTSIPVGLSNGGSSAKPLSLKVADSAKGTGGIWQYMQLGGTAFEANHEYSFTVWLKQEGIEDKSVTVSIQGQTHTFTGVGSNWAQYTWSKIPVTPNNYNVSTARIDFNAPGTMWVAEARLFDSSRPAFTLDPRVLSLWKAFKPATIRFWSNQGNSSSNYSFWSLDSWLSDESIGRNDFGIGNIYAKTSICQHLPTALAYAKEVGANPWFIVNPSLTESEWGDLIDYLCSLAGSTPYALKRPASHPGPYTADFPVIYLEFGNEEWGTQQTATTFPTQHYGAYGHLLIHQAIAGKSYFNPAKVQFIANGFTLAPGNSAGIIEELPEASWVDYFSYSGGDKSLTGDAYYQNELLSVPEGNASSNGSGGSGGVGTFLTQDAVQRTTDGHNGIKYNLAVYEGGPGADLPGSTTQGDDTLAAGTTALDQGLNCMQNGFGPQNFFLFNLGTGPFTSHTDFSHGLVPHPVWEALSMRNLYCSGPMVGVTTGTVPTDAKGSAMIASYAFKNGNTFDVFVISRELNSTETVTLNLPFAPTGSGQLITLTGDPRWDNNTSLKVPLKTESLTGVTKGYRFSMPPGSVYLFQIPTTGMP